MVWTEVQAREVGPLWVCLYLRQPCVLGVAARATATSVGESESRCSLWANKSCCFQMSLRAALLRGHDSSFTLLLHRNVSRGTGLRYATMSHQGNHQYQQMRASCVEGVSEAG